MCVRCGPSCRRRRDGRARTQRAMLCAISGAAPVRAVVTRRGIVYERSLIEKVIEVRIETRERDWGGAGARSRGRTED